MAQAGSAHLELVLRRPCGAGEDEAFRRRYGTATPLCIWPPGRARTDPYHPSFGRGGTVLQARLADLFQHKGREAAAKPDLVLAAALAITSRRPGEQPALGGRRPWTWESIEVREV